MILRRRINGFICVFVCLLLTAGFAQIPIEYPEAFGLYLKKNKLYRDELALVSKLLETPNNANCLHDSLLLRKTALELILNDTTQLNNTLTLFQGNCFSSTNEEKLFTCFLINSATFRKTNTQNFLKSFSDSSQWYADLALSAHILNRNAPALTTNFKKTSADLQELWGRYIKIKRPSPFLAGLFSAFVPGSGKWYIGQTQHFLTALTTNIILGAQAGEALILSGANSFHFIATCSLFSVYYLGNIWGSVAAARKQNKDLYNEIDYEIYRLYTNRSLELSR